MSITSSYTAVSSLPLLWNFWKPTFFIDNDSCEDFTIIKFKVKSYYNNHEILRQVVGLMSKMNIFITNVYMSWDDGWRNPMEVLNVTDSNGNKITDEKVIDYIEKGLEAIKDGNNCHLNLYCYAEESDRVAYCSIELTGTDKRGLCKLKVRGPLAGMDCDLMKVEICTHISQMFAILRALSLVKPSACQYLSLKPARKTTVSSLFETLFERRLILPNPKQIYQNDATNSNRCAVMSSRMHQQVRVMRLPSVNGKGSKTSRIK